MSSLPPPPPLNVLALLLSGVLALSLGLNGWLLARWPEAEPNDSLSLATATADLHHAQRLLAQCQQLQRQDSLALALPTRASDPAVAGQ